MARVELPQSKLRARKRARRWRIAAVCGGAVLVVCGIIIGLSYLPVLQVRAVAVSGTSTLATSTVESYVQQEIAGHYLFVFPKRNIFLYPKRAIAAGLLKQFPELKSADVRAANFHTLAVTVVEREPKALWCGSGPSQGRCLYVDESGVVYGPASGADDSLVTYLGETNDTPVSDSALQYLTPEKFRALTALIDALSGQEQDNPVREVAVDLTGDARADFQNGFVLIFSLNDAQGDVFERFNLAFKAEPFASHKLSDFDYLDLRFGDKLYYKLK